MPDATLATAIRTLLQDSPFHGEGYRKVWARLRVAGIRTSPRRVLRVMRENSLLVHQRPGSARGPRAHDGTITTGRVDEMWGTDLTTVLTGEGQAAVFIAVDHCSAECVGIHASHRNRPAELRDPHAAPTRSQLIAQAMSEKAVTSGKVTAAQVAQFVFDAMAARRFYVFSHPRSLGTVQLRMEDVVQLRNPSDPFADRPQVALVAVAGAQQRTQ